MKESEVYIHIGLPKTGTTFLQHLIFPMLRDVNYLETNTNIKNFINNYNLKNQFLISSESLSGNPFSGYWFRDFKNNIVKVKKLFPDASIILGVREHKSLIKSLFNQYLHEGGTKDFTRFFNQANDEKYFFERADLSYKLRIELIEEYFENVYCFSFEEFKVDFESFFRKFGRFLGVRLEEIEEIISYSKKIKSSNINKGVGLLQGEILRKLNRFDFFLRKMPGSPSLNNKYFNRLRLSPRALCQRRLKNIDHRELNVRELISPDVDQMLNEDWEWTLNYLKENEPKQ